MTDELRALCALNGEVLFGCKEYKDKNRLDWNEMYNLSKKQSVVSTVAYSANSLIPKDLQKQWIFDIYQIEKNSCIVSKANLIISELLEENHIPFVIIKGLASNSYYKKPYYRIQGDVDFLVQTDKVEHAKKLLSDNGFVEQSVVDYEVTYEKNGVVYELHSDVSGLPEGEKGQKIKSYLEDIISTAVPLQTNDGVVMIPDEFHHGLVLLVHTAKHLVSFGTGLRQVSDWAVFVNTIGERFPEVFKEALSECGLWSFAQALTAVCVKYLNMKALSWLDDFSDDFLDSFMDDLLRKGGICHDDNDDMDALLVENTDRGGASDSPMLIQLIINISRKAQYRWPYMKKIKLLIPFGMLIMCTQYALGMLTGKYKKINPIELTSKANARRKLYKDLKLFE